MDLFKCKNSEEDQIDQEDQEDQEYKKDSSEIDVLEILDANISKNLISMSVDTLVDKFNNFDFVLPKYQRKYVWNKDQIAKLALSVIKNIPIPPIYVYQDHEDGTNVILDGQQRMISLFLYYNDLTVKRGKKNNFINFYEITKKHSNSDLTLKEVIAKEFPKFIETDYKIQTDYESSIDITYSNLTRSDKRKLGARYIDVVFLDVKAQEKESVYSNIFNLLNSEGTPLEKQEIRNGVYRSKFYDMVHDLNNEDENWRKLFGQQHEKSKDVELLLRLLALDYYTYIDPDNCIKFKNDEKGVSLYKGSYNLLLDKYSQQSKKFNEDEIKKCRENLTSFFSKFKLEDKKALEKKGNKTINHLLLESLYVAYIKNNECLDTINDKLIKEIQTDDKYSKTTKTATSNKINIESRLTSIYRIIQNDRK